MRQLLLLLCHYPFEEKTRDLLSQMLREVKDWNKTTSLINDHGIIALAAYNIKEAGLEKELPADAMAILENGWNKSIVRNLWLRERWKEVNTLLTGAGIKHVLLKGMALEHTLYESKGLRQMNDNDILIRKEDALHAWLLLQQNGFRRTQVKSFLHEKILMDLGKHLPSLYKDNYSIEIHHNLFVNNDSGIDPINDAREILIDNIKAWILPEKLQLTHLIKHFKKHMAEGDCQLRLYNDIILLDNNSDLKIPDDFISNPIQKQNSRFTKGAYKIYFASIPAGKRFRFLVGDIFPSMPWLMKRYKCSKLKAFLYYPLRIGKLGRFLL